MRATMKTLLGLAGAGGLLLAGCGGSGGDGNNPPTGDHTYYVIDSLLLPTTSTESLMYGRDLDGDGIHDNQLGMVLSLLGLFGFDTQGGIDTAVASGGILLLGDLQAADYTSTDSAAFTLHLGASPTPAPCLDSSDVVCGQHLHGSGSFEVVAGTANTLSGPIQGGTFSGGPGTANLQVSVINGNPLTLSLIGARIELSDITPVEIGSGVIAGAILQSQLNDDVIPSIAASLADTIATDCTGSGPPDCGCTAGSVGATVVATFDGNDDCAVSALEIQSIVALVLTPDVTIDGQPAISLGVAISAVAATFTPP
jgi:hypothetical protein